MAFELYRMLERYADSVPAPGHLASKFTVKAGGIHQASKVMWDVKRSNRKIAFPQADASAGYHMNGRQGFTNKETAPPVYMEGASLVATDLMGVRQFGEDPFSNPNFTAAVNDIMSMNAEKISDMIQGSLELMAAQILTTGAISLKDSSNVVRFAEDFAPKDSHFPNASVAWSSASTAVPLADIADLCDKIVDDGKTEPERITMNSNTFEEMIATDSFKAAMSKDVNIWNGEVSVIGRETGMRGAKRRGRIRCRNYVLDVYTYDVKYEDPYSSSESYYIPDGKWIVESGGRYDATFGGIVTIGKSAEAMSLLGGARITQRDLLQDLDLNAWISNDRTSINLGIGTRPLLIPVGIDTFGCGDADAA